ncbi:hypothetical protein Ssi02_16610 [Sinosporangium siamense]|uniref:Uncharacterized protein n=1 Tax=Sinosporangium siamense TaxID=1367973 RepID=A0A919REP6_9ACTN|nr:hypothetical protein Ssi02_16610 [Sinosporangium siamense]
MSIQAYPVFMLVVLMVLLAWVHIGRATRAADALHVRGLPREVRRAGGFWAAVPCASPLPHRVVP